MPAAPHAMNELVPNSLSHLTDEDLQFFKTWVHLSSLETEEVLKTNKLKKISKTTNITKMTKIVRKS